MRKQPTNICIANTEKVGRYEHLESKHRFLELKNEKQFSV
jgi:hypothetical protein